LKGLRGDGSEQEKRRRGEMTVGWEKRGKKSIFRSLKF